MNSGSSKDGDMALLTYKPDHPRRSWAHGDRFEENKDAPVFKQPPQEPIHVEVKKGYSGEMIEFWDDPIPVMTTELFKTLKEAGVKNIDTYKVEIYDPNTDRTYDNYVAYNIVGMISDKDLGNDNDEAVVYRLKESVNAIMVSEKVKKYIESKKFDTIKFIERKEFPII